MKTKLSLLGAMLSVAAVGCSNEVNITTRDLGPSQRPVSSEAVARELQNMGDSTPTEISPEVQERLEGLLPVDHLAQTSKRLAYDVVPAMHADPSGDVSEETVDLRPFDTPVKSQGSRGTCTAFATVGVIENLAKHRWGKDYDLSEEHEWSLYARPYSQLAVQAAAGNFLVSEADLPYNSSGVRGGLFGRFGGRPKVDASKGLIKGGQFTTIQPTVTDVIEAVKSGKPVMFSLDVNRSFMNTVKTKGVVNPNDRSVIGGHAIALVGVVERSDLTKYGGGYFIIKNSWSVQNGDKGYNYIPFSYCEKHGCYEAYTFDGSLLENRDPSVSK